MRDDKIYALIKAKQDKGLSLLMDKYGGLVFYIVKNTGIHNEEDAAECVSDILFIIWKRIDRYEKDKSSFKTWIIMIARSCAIDHLRKVSRHKKTIPIDEISELCSDNKEFERLGYDRLIQLLQQLPPPDNAIFYRRFVLGESVKDIAKLLDLTADNIYKRLSRGREKLKKLIKEGY